MSLLVIYIARGADGGAKAVFDFFDTYMAIEAGCNHRLGVIFKGWDLSEQKNSAIQLAKSCNALIYETSDDGFDWGAYMRVMPYLDEFEEICFLNTYSRPLTKNWLRILKFALNSNECRNIGAVGATGSWETYLQRPRFRLPPSGITQYLKFAINYFRFKPFPNYHLRSNAFMCKKSVFESFIKGLKIPKTKFDAILMESGRQGFSTFLLRMGCRVVVVGADGISYDKEEWNKSRTFRSESQLNLLVSDNRTIQYDQASGDDRKKLEILAWGSSQGTC